MTVVTEWVKDIFVAISFLEILLPAGNMEKYVKYIFALIILATILAPLVNFMA